MVESDLAAVLRGLRPVPDNGGLVGADAERCARALGVDGVAVSVVFGHGLNELLWATEGTSTHLEDLQYTLGQGPGPEVASSGRAVLVPDLAREPPGRWPALLPDALELGVGAVFCFPLRVGTANLGALTLQRAAPGAPERAALAEAWMVTNALTAALVRDTDAWEAFAAAEDSSHFYRAAVHQAAGMISVQAGVSVAEALVRLRAHAFRRGLPMVEAAEDVVARRVHFRDADDDDADDDDDDEPGARDRRRD